jgi:hypothetical protein
MKHYYKTTGMYCLDPCPYNDKAMVGSSNCRKCEHNIHTNVRFEWVECEKFNEEKEVGNK